MDRQIILSKKGKASSPATSADNAESKGGSPFPNFLCARRIGVVGRIAMDKQLQKHECSPSQAGNEWAQKFWKGKAIFCAVLEAHLPCTQKEIKDSLLPSNISYIEHAALKSENGILKSLLAFEREIK